MDEDKNKVAVLPTGICKAKENVPGEPTTIYLPLDEMKSELLNEEEEFPDDQSSDEINLLNTEFRKEEETILEEQHTLFTPQVKQEIIEESPDVIKQEFYEEVLPYETKQETLKLELPHDQLTKQCVFSDVSIFPNEDSIQELHYGKQVIGTHHPDIDTTKLVPTSHVLAQQEVCKTALVDHKQTHKNGRKYKCDVCNKEFTTSGNFSKHKMVHSGIEKGQRGKAFITSIYLTKHKSIHSTVRKRQCDVCGIFMRSNDLSRHKLIHSDHSLYKCDICNKTFKQSQYLAKHKLIHSAIKQQYQCDECDKTLTHRSALFQHKLIHSGVKKYKCDVCGKAFTQNPGLIQHKLRHTGVKKYECNVCNTKFLRVGDITRHKLTRCGIKKYQCGVCSKRFIRSNQLSQHELNHCGSKEEPTVPSYNVQ